MDSFYRSIRLGRISCYYYIAFLISSQITHGIPTRRADRKPGESTQLYSILSIAIAVASPPPMQSAAMPRLSPMRRSA